MVKNELYLIFIRSKSCAVCQSTNVDAHHLVTRGAGGSDYQTIPLCREHHQEYHQYGQKTFENRYRTQVWKVCCDLLCEFAGYTEQDPFDLARTAVSESENESDE